MSYNPLGYGGSGLAGVVTPLMLSSSNVLSISYSGSTTDGALSSTDWNKFNTSAEGGVKAIGLFGSQTASTDGLVILGTNLYAQGATISVPGMVTTSAQTWGGAKTFTSAIVANLTGNVSGSAASFTGSLSGDVTGTQGATVIPANSIGYSKFSQVSASSLIGNPTGSLANASGITLGPSLQFSGTTLTTIQPISTSSGPTFAAIKLTAGASNGFILTSNALGEASWQAAIDGGVTVVGTIDSQTPSSNALVISGNTIYAQSASSTSPGMISLGSQTFTGSKTFNATIVGSVSGSASSFTGSLSGDVTGTQSSTTIASNVVSYAKFQQVAAISLVGNPTAGLANASGVTLGNSLSFSGSILNTVQNIRTTDAVIFDGVKATTTLQLQAGAATGYILSSSNSSGLASWVPLGSLGVSSITGTANQVIASSSTGAITLSLPQSIATTSSVIFSTIRLSSGASNGFVLTSDASGNASWAAAGASGVIAIGTIDSQAASLNGLVISGNTLYTQTASASAPGMVSTGSQTFTGSKTFNATIIGSVSGSAATFTGALSGDITGNQAATTIANYAVTYGKLQQLPAATLIANPTGSLANAAGVTLGGSLQFSGTTLTTIQPILTTSSPTFSGITLSAGASNGYVLTSDASGVATWQTGVDTGVISIGTIDTQTASSNGLVIASRALYAQSASTSNPGMVNLTTQSLAGAKTFTGNLVASSLASVATAIDTTSSLTVAASSRATTLLLSGSVTAVASTTQHGIAAKQVFSPVANSGLTSAFFSNLDLSVPSGVTVTVGASYTASTNYSANLGSVTNAIGFYHNPGGTFSGSVANSYGGFFGDCPTGTTTANMALYAANMSIGDSTLNLRGTNNLYVAGKTITNTFQLLTSPGTGKILVSDASGNGAWAAAGTSVTTIGAIDSQTASANALVIVGANLYAQSASTSNPGMVNITTQSFSGNKTFTGNVTVSGLTSTATFQLTTSPGTGKILVSDASGNGTWTTAAIAGVNNVGTYDTMTSSNGLTISGVDIFTQSATATLPGMVSTGNQIWAGIKVFNNDIVGLSRATVGGTLNTNASLSIGAPKSFGILLDGTISTSSGVTNSTQVSVLSQQVMSPTSGGSGLHGFYSNNSVIVPSGQTVNVYSNYGAIAQLSANVGTLSNAYGYLYSQGVTFTGTVTNAYGVYASSPPSGTTSANLAIYADNMSIGDNTKNLRGTNNLYVAGKAITNTFQLLTTPTNNFVLTSDGSGNGTWQAPTASGVLTIGTLNSQTPSANGAVITGTSLVLQSASSTNPGLMDTASQTFTGTKTFNATIVGSVSGSAATFTGSLVGDVVGTQGATVIQNYAVTYSKFQQVAASSLVGNPTTGLANAAGITLGSSLGFSGTSLNTVQGITTSSSPEFASIKLTSGAVNNYVLTSNASGVASWAAPSASGVLTVGTLNSQTASANGAVITGTSLVLQSASASNAGLIDTLAQTFVGVKTFNSTISGNISGSSASFTGSLSGDVTGTQSSTTIASNVVSYAKFQQVAASSLVGNPTGSIANAAGITLGSSLVFSGTTVNTVQAITTSSSPTFSGITLTSGASNGYILTSNGSGVASWAAAGASGVLTIGTLDSQTASTNGAVISSTSLVLQSGSTTRPGLVNNTTQSFSGSKTFTGNLVASSSAAINTTIDSDAILAMNVGSTQSFGIKMSGSMTQISASNNQYGVACLQNFTPNAPVGLVSNFYARATYASSSSATVVANYTSDTNPSGYSGSVGNYIGFFHPIGGTFSGSVANAYGGYFNSPPAGTSGANMALFASNMSIGDNNINLSGTNNLFVQGRITTSEFRLYSTGSGKMLVSDNYGVGSWLVPGSVGVIGEYASNYISRSAAVTLSTSGDIGDILSLTLDRGVWNMGFNGGIDEYGNVFSWLIGISYYSGNTFPDLEYARNTMNGPLQPLGTTSLFGYTVAPSAPTTFYLKMSANFAPTPVAFFGTLYAYRVTNL